MSNEAEREWFWTRVGLAAALALVLFGGAIKILIATGVLR